MSILGAPLAAQVREAGSPSSFAAAEKVFDAEFARHPIGSLTVGVVEGGRLAWGKAYGWADMEGRVPATRNTVYRIGSVTKQFTGLALLRLVAEQRVRLEDPASRYVPELANVRGFGRGGSAVTLLSLATHRAGLSREPDEARFEQGPIDEWQSILRQALSHTSEEFRPNAEGVYSNIGYATLGLTLETAAGTPYVDLVERGLLGPLGMTSSGFRPSTDMLARLAKGYALSGGLPSAEQSKRELHNGRGYRIPNGGLFSTVDDLAKFLAFEMGYGPQKILAQATLTANFSRSYPIRGGAFYGIGFLVVPWGQKSLVGHDGSVAGYSSSAFFDPPTRLGIICLRSADYSCEGSFLEAAFDALEGPRE